MGKRIVGITGGTILATAKNGPRHILNRAYVWAVERAGGVPIILPAISDAESIERYMSLLDVLDGLLLSGGVDVDPMRYGQEAHPELGTVDADRDATELSLIRVALERDLPIFAICRGIQVLNVALGGTLYQDLPSELPGDIVHAQDTLKIPREEATHSIRIEPGTRLADIVGAEEMRVNSFHHQALRDVASPLRVTAYAPDGVIEAAESPTHRYLVAVQFHPEETAVNDKKSQRLFDAFVRALD